MRSYCGRTWAGFVAVLSLSAMSLSGCASTEPTKTVASPVSTSSPSEVTTSTPAPAGVPIFVAVVGDSNSTGSLGTLESGTAAGVAWVAQLPTDQFASAGGWAVDGATTGTMADAAVPITSADVLVIMGGTNDLAAAVPADEVTGNLQRIADIVGVPDVVIAAIPPLDFRPQEAIDLNVSLAEFAASRGWRFVDPWVDVRNADGTWVSAYRTDGVHTSPEGYAAAAAQIARQLQPADR